MYLLLHSGVTFGVTIRSFLNFNDDDWLVARVNLGTNAKAVWHFTATILLEVQVEFNLGLSVALLPGSNALKRSQRRAS
jgi:hypothetical protein